jgi:hypothetical protein
MFRVALAFHPTHAHTQLPSHAPGFRLPEALAPGLLSELGLGAGGPKAMMSQPFERISDMISG